LTDYKTKLVLFPTVAGQPKKGEIHDSTAKPGDQVQNTVDGVYALPTPVRRVKAAALTKEMAGAKTYFKQRTERTNKKLAGKREKKIRDKEASK